MALSAYSYTYSVHEQLVILHVVLHLRWKLFKTPDARWVAAGGVTPGFLK